MRDELYINGRKTDLGNSDISLSYNSNLLTDISKIASNNSYTIKMPKTLNNLSIIECANMPTGRMRFPYIVHSGMLVRDGVAIVKDADVILLCVSETIEVALLWGNVNTLRPVTEKSLRDLRYTAEDFVPWVKGTENSRTFPKIDYGFVQDESAVWYHPCATVKWIMDKIADSSAVRFSFPEDRLTEMENMFVPLLDRNDSEINSLNNIIELTPRGAFWWHIFEMISFEVKVKGEEYCTWSKDYILKNKQKKIKCLIRGYIRFEAFNQGNFGKPNSSKKNPIVMNVRDGGNQLSPILASASAEVTHIEGNKYLYSFSFKDCDIELEPGNEVSFELSDVYSGYNYNFANMDTGHISIIPRYDPIELGSKFYIVPNLPDMKQIDFIKGISNMLGLFAIPVDGGIRFVSFDELEKNKSKNVDWTAYLVKREQTFTPSSISYSVNDVAQINRFRYKDDEVKDEDTLRIDDKTLPFERVACELPFAASKMLNGSAVIPLYSYDGGNLKYESGCQPRILKFSENSGAFYGLSWSVLLERYYSNYKRHISDAKIIVERFRLNSVKLMQLDLSVPVYLRQFGSFFAIINIKTRQDNICEVRLLKI